MPSQVKYYYTYGGERVIFDKDELLELKTVEKPGTGYRNRTIM